MDTVTIQITQLDHAADMPLPAYGSSHAAGADIRAAVADDVVINPGERALIPGGFAMALPDYMEAQVRPRSGLALKHGITVLNAPGTIDADYRGEVGVILINLGQESFTIHRGDRIAQLVIAPCLQAAWQQVDVLDGTARGSGGFGSTGKV
ncbi:MAG: dUTP diphosphatase [Mariprofundales bacterium]